MRGARSPDRGPEALGVADAATGRLRWSIDDAHDLPGRPGKRWWKSATRADRVVVGAGADWSVLVGYSTRCTSCRTQEFGVAELSGTDGHVRWMTPVVPPAAPGPNTYADLIVANDTVALLDVYDEIDGHRPPILAAVDVATGKRLWTRAGAAAATVAGNTVLAWQRTNYSPGEPTPPSVLMALDAATGTLLWRTARPVPAGAFAGAAGGVAVLPSVARSGVHESVVDLRSGHELGALDITGRCAIDDHPGGDALVACLSGDVDRGFRVVTIRPGDHRFRASRRLLHSSEPGIDTVWQGYIFIKADQRTDAVTDDAGNIVASGVPGRVLAISNRYAVLQDMDGYAVRRLTR